MSSVLCKEMISDPGPKGWNGGEAEWKAERQVLCRQLYRSLTALGRCYALLLYMSLIDPDFSVYTRALMVSSKLDRKRKQAVVSMSGRQTLFSLAATAEQVHSTAVSSTGQWEYRVSNSLSLLNLYGSPKQKKVEILQPFLHRAAALQQKHGDLWYQSNPDRWLEKLSIDLNSRYSLWLLTVYFTDSFKVLAVDTTSMNKVVKKKEKKLLKRDGFFAASLRYHSLMSSVGASLMKIFNH